MSVHLLVLGSNITPETALPRAIELLRDRFGKVRTSRVVVSPAVGAPGTPDFHNQAVLAASALPPAELKRALRAIEQAMGRVRSADRNAPRVIDIDHVASVAGDPDGLAAARRATRPLAAPPADRELLDLAHLLVPAGELLPRLTLPHQASTLETRILARAEWPMGFRILVSPPPGG